MCWRYTKKRVTLILLLSIEYCRLTLQWIYRLKFGMNGTGCKKVWVNNSIYSLFSLTGMEMNTDTTILHLFWGNLVDKLMTSEEYSIDPDFSILFPPLVPVGRSGLWHFLHCNSESVEKRKKDLFSEIFS